MVKNKSILSWFNTEMKEFLLSSYLQQLPWTLRRCLRRCSTPAAFWLWLNAREVQALYPYTGNGRVLNRWEEPAAGAETDCTDATVDADQPHTHSESGLGWQIYLCFLLLLFSHLCEEHAHAFTRSARYQLARWVCTWRRGEREEQLQKLSLRLNSKTKDGVQQIWTKHGFQFNIQLNEVKKQNKTQHIFWPRQNRDAATCCCVSIHPFHTGSNLQPPFPGVTVLTNALDRPIRVRCNIRHINYAVIHLVVSN